QLARGIRALRIALAAVEHGAPTSAPAHELALPALGAHHAGLLLRLLDVLAIRVTGAADEGTKAAAPLGEWLPAFGAHLAFEDLELRLALSLERLGVIARAGRERLPLLALRESGARIEPAIATELDHDRSPALRADAIGGLLGHVGLLSRLRLLLDALAERLEEIADDRDPLDLAVGDLVQVLFHPRGEARVDDVREVLVQEVRHDESDVLGNERASFLPNVLPANERRDGRRIGRRPSDAELLEGLDERRLGETRRRLREVLSGVEPEKLERLAGRDFRKWRDLLLGLLRAFGVDAKEAIEEDAATVRAEYVLRRLDVQPRVLEPRRRHLRCDRALPDHRVEAQLFRLQEPLDAVRAARKIGRPDRLVRFLRTLRARLVVARLVQRVLGAELVCDDIASLVQCALCDVERVGAHVRDQPDGAARSHRDALVELLREDHRPLDRIPELPRCLLL